MMAVFIRLSIILSTAVLVSTAEVDYCKRRCPCENSMSGAVHLPSEWKTKYYVCNYGIGVLMPCGPGTYFNPKLQVCDWPANAKAVKCGADHEEYVKCKPGDESSGDGDYLII